MKRPENEKNRSAFFWICALVFFLVSGCATLPGSISISRSEKNLVRQSFVAALSRSQCGCCLDADVTITFNSFLQSGAVSGYFEAKSPSYVKFVGENPFGQPVFIFTTDGSDFSYSPVLEKKVYQGKVSGSAYKKYAPPGFSPDAGFYWFTGRLWPGRFKIQEVGRQKDGKAYWLKLSGENSDAGSLVLYDSEEQVIRRHIIVDENNKSLLDVSYDGYASLHDETGDSPCKLPGEIIFRAAGRKVGLKIYFREWAENADSQVNDFVFIPPANFQKTEVK